MNGLYIKKERNREGEGVRERDTEREREEERMRERSRQTDRQTVSQSGRGRVFNSLVSESRFLGFYKERLLTILHLAILYSVLGEHLMKHRPILVPCLSFCKKSIYMERLGKK